MDYSNLYFRRAYYPLGGGKTFEAGDKVLTDRIKLHAFYLLKGQRAIISEEELIECIKSGAVKVPPKSEYYEKSLKILGQSPKVEEVKDPDPVVVEVVEKVEELVVDVEYDLEGELPEEVVEETTEEPTKYTKEYLESLKMGDLRPIGDEYDVKDNNKSELIEKILKAQGE